MTEEDNREDTELRLYCVMRSDLAAVAGKPIPLGKLISQGGHAFDGCIEVCPELLYLEYVNDGARPKITIEAKNEHALRRAFAECQQAGLSCYLVTDAGRTVFPEPTMTCLGIGPVRRIDLPKYVRNFQLLDEMREG